MAKEGDHFFNVNDSGDWSDKVLHLPDDLNKVKVHH